MNSGDLTIIVHNRSVRRFAYAYRNLQGKLPRILSNSDLDRITKSRELLVVITTLNMEFGEIKLVIENKCVTSVEPKYDYMAGYGVSKK